MPIKALTPTPDQIRELRRRFVEKCATDPPAAPFHAIDIDRVKNKDLWCQRFLEMYDLDMDVAFEKLWETCIWRQQYGTNDLCESNLRAEYLRDGVIFSHNKDLDGKPILIFKTKLHVKGVKDMDEVIRVVVYWIERLHRETHMDKITIFFDMAGTSMGSMDLDFVKRIIETFKLYYPNALNYILIYEMAWVLNAVFKIIKGLLPAKALEILKMITKKDIGTYIDKDNCLTAWGGNDDYTFQFVPEQIGKRPTLALKTNGTANGAVPTATADSQCNGQDRKVHFANGSPTKRSLMTDYQDHYKDTSTPQDQDMLRISPSEFITFTRGESNESTVDITAIGNFPVTYKIQTTSPEKFRVRPRCGVLNQGESISVSILLKPEHHLADSSKDKFLVMCMPVPPGADHAPQQIVELWKQKPTNSSEIEQHRLCCVYKTPDGARNGYGRSESGDKEITDTKSGHNINDLSKHAKKLERQLKFTQVLQCLTLIFLLILSAAVLYLLRLQTAGDATDEEAEELAQAAPLTGSCGRARNL